MGKDDSPLREGLSDCETLDTPLREHPVAGDDKDSDYDSALARTPPGSDTGHGHPPRAILLASCRSLFCVQGIREIISFQELFRLNAVWFGSPKLEHISDTIHTCSS